MNVAQKIVSPIVKGCQKVAKSSADYKAVAQRAAQMKDLNPANTFLLKQKCSVLGAVRPVMKKVQENSDSFNLAIETVKDVKRKGVKNSKPIIKGAFKELVGINDVKAATLEGGKAKGVLEGVKAATRLLSTLGLFVAGNLVPVPGASIAGWVAGEKITEKCLGKPYTKKIKI